MPRLKSNIFLAVFLTAFFVANEASAGFLTTTTLSWKSFSFEPRKDEATPNYFGYGFGLNLGYSFAQVFDIAAYGNYLPARLKRAEFFQEDASLLGYGGEMAFRLFESVYVAFRGGSYRYALMHRYDDHEIRGHWRGNGIEFALGATFAVTKSSFWQVSLDYGRLFLLAEEAQVRDEVGTRKIATFGVNLSYVFNGFSMGSAVDGIFKDFFKSLSF